MQAGVATRGACASGRRRPGPAARPGHPNASELRRPRRRPPASSPPASPATVAPPGPAQGWSAPQSPPPAWSVPASVNARPRRCRLGFGVARGGRHRDVRTDLRRELASINPCRSARSAAKASDTTVPRLRRGNPPSRSTPARDPPPSRPRSGTGTGDWGAAPARRSSPARGKSPSIGSGGNGSPAASWETICTSFIPCHNRLPASISHSITPTAKRSARRSTSTGCSCSGAI